MPEIPELAVYAQRIESAAGGRAVTEVRLASPFLLRSVEVAPERLIGARLESARRAGKLLALGFAGREGGPLWMVIHLMLAGRLDWRPAAKPLHRRDGALKLAFGDAGALVLTERGSRKQAALYVVRDPAGVARVQEAAVDPLSPEFTLERLARALSAEARQLKGALTDPRVVGLGNAYADEILWVARLSPLALTTRLEPAELARLQAAIREELPRWIEVVDAACPDGAFPVDQRAWRRDMAVHGKHGSPCPACGTQVERISFKEKETHYCPGCQTGGRRLADRRRSRFLK